MGFPREPGLRMGVSGEECVRFRDRLILPSKEMGRMTSWSDKPWLMQPVFPEHRDGRKIEAPIVIHETGEPTGPPRRFPQ